MSIEEGAVAASIEVLIHAGLEYLVEVLQEKTGCPGEAPSED